MIFSDEQFKKDRSGIIDKQNTLDIWQKTQEWLFDDNMWQYQYNFEWLSRPIVQYPQDIVAFQEIVYKVKPDLIIETGIAHGGSLVLSASLLAMLEYAEAISNNQKNLNIENPKRMVVGIDIREHNREIIKSNPFSNRIEMLKGSSIDKHIIDEVHQYAKDFNNILVCLDSNHTYEHVLTELEAYANLVAIDSYCIVSDTIIEFMPDGSCSNRAWGKGNNPYTALHAFLKENDNFEIDKRYNDKLLITAAIDGYLKRVK